MPVPPAAHLVHFYSTPEALAESLCGFFAEPLKRGESVIVVARPEHRQALDAALRGAGVDLAADIRAGRYVSLDVNETLDAFLVDDRPSRELFDSQARAMVLGAKNRTGAVHVYGEMSATLLARGDIVGVMELDGMWAELVHGSPFPLICGYPREVLESDLGIVLDGVASVHDAFVAHRWSGRGGPAVVDLALGPDATVAARRHVRTVLVARGHDEPDHLDAAAVVVTELVGSAARQGSRHVRLSLTFDETGDVLSLLEDAGPPEEAVDAGDPEDDMADTGRSFVVLDALAEGWGVERTRDGRTAWARLRRPSVA